MYKNLRFYHMVQPPTLYSTWVSTNIQWRVHRIYLNITDWKFHQDNAPAHTTFFVTRFLADSKVSTFLQSSYSAGMAPPDFFLLPQLKTHERTLFLDSWQSQRDLYQDSKEYSKGGLPWRLRYLEIWLKVMFRCRRRIF